MVLNTLTVSTAVTPTVIQTYISHYLNRQPLRQKPTAHISYHEGIKLIRSFLEHASHHTVEELQAFTSQWVPCPTWVKVEQVTLPEKIIDEAAATLIAQLGHKGVDRVGGEKWWQWRRNKLQAEWIEMKRDYTKRKQTRVKSNRVMLYVHGGAYFFGSVDEHRYQIQRHARKLEARVFAPRYRLAPQYPFPCGLHDCLSAYLYLLTLNDPSEIILAGDSAGGGMIVSMLVMLRDRGLQLPAGAILIPPWVDLSHSFPSVAQESVYDYIPSHGFMAKPSASWPPPNSEDMSHMAQDAVKEVVDESLPRKSSQPERKKAEDEAAKGLDATFDRKLNHDISILLDGKTVSLKDQIQMYTTNQLISHPLVSPILQPSLGGLPPLLIMVGGGEVLRDEQIYLAHKASNPTKYPPSQTILDDLHCGPEAISKWKPTQVQLQVWDDLCHVAPTLSFTKPAKFMYRSIAQFGAWILARAQKTQIDIQDDDAMSIISSDSDAGSQMEKPQTNGKLGERIGRAGEPLPSFKHHMIRQRVDRNGNIFPLDPASSLPALNLAPDDIGVPKPGPVKKWLDAKQEWDQKYAREKRKIQKQRIMEMAQGYQSFGNDEVPPPSALAGRRGSSMPKEEKRGRSWGMSLWSLWGSAHDQNTMEREEKAEKDVETTTVVNEPSGTGKAQASATREASRSKSRRRTVTYSGEEEIDENTPAAVIAQKKEEKEKQPYLAPPTIQKDDTHGLPEPKTRPSAGGKAFPFKLRPELSAHERNPSTITLMSEKVATPKAEDENKQLGAQIQDEESIRNIAPEQRRMTKQDASGVLFKGGEPNRQPEISPAATETSTPVGVRDNAQAESNISTENAAPEQRRMTKQDDAGVLFKAIKHHQQAKDGLAASNAAKLVDESDTAGNFADVESIKGISPEQRRTTRQDESGVLFKASATPQESVKKPTTVLEAAEPATVEDTAEDSDDTLQGVAEEGRRMTMADKDGVLHKGEAKKPERPAMERFETAKEEM